MAARDSGNGNPLGKQTQNPLLLSIHDDMLAGLGQLSDYFGFSKVIGQLFGALLMSDSPLCLDDLVERLDISKANVSINMRTLENLGMVHQVWVKGSSPRRKYYAAETDFWQVVSNILKSRELRDVGRALDVMDVNIRRVKQDSDSMTAEDRALAEVYIDRMRRLREVFEFAQMMIQVILSQVDEALDEERDSSAVLPSEAD
ncbi:MAG: ArsR family transcriptional regulator [Anaerolineae bacterium]|nr:ArsR family transcriptional regulator [Anaerolineae bacterium]